MTDHFFLEMTQLEMFGFKFVFLNCLHTISPVITATILFLRFMLYSSSFVGTLKNETPGAAPELYQLKIKAALTRHS